MAVTTTVGSTVQQVKKAGLTAVPVNLKESNSRMLPPMKGVPAQEMIFDPVEAYNRFKNAPELYVDIETSGLNPWRDKIAVIAINEPNVSNTVAVLHTRGKVPPCIIELLSQPRTLVGHNVIGFDALFLHVAGVDVFTPTWVDTLVTELTAVKSGRRDVRVNLASSVKRRTGVVLDKSIDHSTWMQPTLTEEQLAYAAGDVRMLPRLLEEQRKEVFGTDQARAMEFELKLLPAVLRMVINGLPFDLEEYTTYIEKQITVRDAKKRELIEIFGNINFRSPIQLKRALEQKGLSLASTAHDILVNVANMGGEQGRMVQVLLDYRGPDQRIKMYDSEWIAQYVTDGRVHPRIWQCATDTGRMSNSDPNLQQIPKDEARKMFKAPPGWQIVSSDYSQIEVRVAAYYARDQAMLEALEQEDLHSAVAAQMFNKPIEEVTKEERSLSKAATFTLLFGGGARRLFEYAKANGSPMSMELAKWIVDQFFTRFTGLAIMRQKAFEKAGRGGPVTMALPTGLKRVLIGKTLAGTVILNTLVQGTAAAGLKCGLMEAHKRGLTEYIGASVHDEFVGCVPAGMAKDFADELEECMRLGMAQVVPGTPVRIGTAINQSWYNED